MHQSVTNDLQVIKAMRRDRPRSSRLIAKKVGVTVFQITARLASMEKRGLVARVDGKWIRKIMPEKLEAKQRQEELERERRRAAFTYGQGNVQRILDENAVKVDDTHGWSSRILPISPNRWVKIFRDPISGTEYTEALATEPADVLREFPDIPAFSPFRLKVFDKRNVHYRQIRRYISELESSAAST